MVTNMKEKWKTLWLWLKKRWWLPVLGVLALIVIAISTQERPVEVESIAVKPGLVREFLLEEAKTRLDKEYLLTLPLAGEIPRLKLEVGDWVEAGDTLLTLRRFARSQELTALRAQSQEIRARNEGVSTQMPTPEDLATARNQITAAQNQWHQAQEQKSARELELAELEHTLQRQENLREAGAISQSQLDETRKQVKVLQKTVQQDFLSLQTAEKNLENSKLALEKLKRQRSEQAYLHRVYGAQSSQLGSQIALKQDELQRSRLIAPVSGPVLEIYAPNAGLLNAGAQILKLGDPHSLEVETDLLSEDIHRVKVGQSAEISGKALDDQILKGKVKRVYPSGFTKISALGVEQQRVKVLIALPPGQHHLLPGTRVDARIITAAKAQTLRIPERALFKQDNLWHVFKIQDGRLHLQAVKIGLKNEDWAEVLSGLKAGDQVVSRLENSFKDQQKAKAIPAKAIPE